MEYKGVWWKIERTPTISDAAQITIARILRICFGIAFFSAPTFAAAKARTLGECMDGLGVAVREGGRGSKSCRNGNNDN